MSHAGHSFRLKPLLGHDDASKAHRHSEDSDARHIAHVTMHHDHDTGKTHVTHSVPAFDMEDGDAEKGELLVEKTHAADFRETRDAHRASLDSDTLCYDQCVVMRVHGGGKQEQQGCPMRKVRHEPETRRWATLNNQGDSS